MVRSRSPQELAPLVLVLLVGALLLLLITVSGGRSGAVAEAATPVVLAADPTGPVTRFAAEAQPPKPEPLLPAEGTPTLTVKPGAEVALRAAPGGEVVTTLADTTEFDSPTVLSVAERRGGWAGVPSEELPNGELGWVRIEDDGLKIDAVGQRIVLDLSAMTGRLFRGDELEREWAIGIGAPATPTPTGRFSITDEIVGGLNPVYGCCAIAISATQPNLPAGWTGGDRIAIHGTSEPLGQANSTGCPHSAEEDLRAIIEGVPLGTPVTIRS